MKHIFVMFLMLVFAITAQAQTIEQKMTIILAAPDSTAAKIGTVHDLLQTAANTRAALRAEGDTALARLADINKQNAHFTEVVAQHNVLVGAHDAHVAAHDARTAQHNANQCRYYDGHEQDCAAYAAEQNVLNNEAANLDRETAAINQEKATLDAAGQGLQMEIDDFNKYKDDFNSRNETNEHTIDVLMRVLGMLQKTTASCQDVLQNPKSTLEQIHEACGQGFDGNGTQAPLTRSGTGGASQNK